jgi:hypothetical protein
MNGNMIFGLVLQHLMRLYSPLVDYLCVPPFIFFVRLDWCGFLYLSDAEDGCNA